jgi:hypothetical protein
MGACWTLTHADMKERQRLPAGACTTRECTYCILHATSSSKTCRDSPHGTQATQTGIDYLRLAGLPRCLTQQVLIKSFDVDRAISAVLAIPLVQYQAKEAACWWLVPATWSWQPLHMHVLSAQYGSDGTRCVADEATRCWTLLVCLRARALCMHASCCGCGTKCSRCNA